MVPSYPTRLSDSVHIGCKTILLLTSHRPCCLYLKWQCCGYQCKHIQHLFCIAMLSAWCVHVVGVALSVQDELLRSTDVLCRVCVL